jgi:hypothetical protein
MINGVADHFDGFGFIGDLTPVFVPGFAQTFPSPALNSLKWTRSDFAPVESRARRQTRFPSDEVDHSPFESASAGRVRDTPIGLRPGFLADGAASAALSGRSVTRREGGGILRIASVSR